MTSALLSVDDLIPKPTSYHIPIYVFCFLRGLPLAANMMMIVFVAPTELPFMCTDPDPRWQQQENQCKLHNTNGSQVACTSWSFDRSTFGYTLIEQFDLVCERRWLAAFSQSLQLGGIMAGILVFSHISDWWGRKRVAIISLIGTLVLSMASAFAPNIIVFCIAKLLCGVVGCGFGEVAFTLVIETVGPKHRYMSALVVGTGWSFGMALLPLMAYLLKSWYYLQLAICLPLLLLIVLWFFVPESVRWQLSVGHYEAARQELYRLIAYNKRYTTHDVDLLIEEIKIRNAATRQVIRATIRDLFRSEYTLSTLIFTYLMAVTATAWYHMTVSTASIAGSDPYWSFASASLFEFPSKLLNLLIIQHVYRRMTLLCSFMAAALLLAITPLIPNEWPIAHLAILILSKMCVSANGAVARVAVSETYPTVVRSSANAFVIGASRIGTTFAPFFDDLSHYTFSWVPTAIVGSLAVSAAFLAQGLKETFKSPLPDMLQKRGRTPAPFANNSEVSTITVC